MNSRALLPVFVFVVLLVVAIIVGNAFLSYVLRRPVEDVPLIFKMIVHGITLGFIALLAKKYFVK
jgi:hypothetical protein